MFCATLISTCVTKAILLCFVRRFLFDITLNDMLLLIVSLMTLSLLFQTRHRHL